MPRNALRERNFSTVYGILEERIMNSKNYGQKPRSQTPEFSEQRETEHEMMLSSFVGFGLGRFFSIRPIQNEKHTWR